MSHSNKNDSKESEGVPANQSHSISAEDTHHYVTSTRRLSARVLDCRRLLDEGKVAEALVLAKRTPNLFEEHARLQKEDFSEIEKACREHERPLPIWIDPEHVQKLKADLDAQMDEAALQRSLRQAVRGKNIPSAIQFLRLLRDLHPDREDFRKDLMEFERTRLEALRPKIQEVLASGTEDEVLTLAAEVEQPWEISLDPELKGPVLQKAGEIRQQRRVDEVQALIDKVSMAYSASDWKIAAPLMGEVEGYLSAWDVQLPEDLQREWQDDLEWFRSQKEKLAKDREFEQAVLALQEAVKEGDSEVIDRALRKVRVFELPFSEDLARQAERRIENLQVEKDRVRKRNAALMIAALALLVAGGLTFYTQVQRQARVEAVVELLETMALPENEDVEGMESLLRRLELEETRVYRHASIQDRLRLLDRVKQVRESREQALAEVLMEVEHEAARDDLIKLHGETYEELKQRVESDLQEAEASMARTPEERARLSRTAANWREASQLREQHIRQQWNEWETKARQELSSLDETPNELEAFTQKRNEVAEVLQSRPEFPGEASAAVYAELESRYENWLQDRMGEEEQLNRISETENLRDYLLELETFITAYPEHEHVSMMKRILERRSMYEDFMVPISLASADNPFWGEVSRRSVAGAVEPEVWKEVRDEVASWDVDKTLVNVYSFVDQGRTGFVLGPLPNLQVVGSTHKFQLNFYHPASGKQETVPEFAETEITAHFLRRAVQQAECKMANEIFAKLKFTDAGSAYSTLFTESTRLISNTSLNAIYRLDLGKYLLEQLAIIAPDAVKKEIERLHARMDAVDNSLHWLCMGHPQYEIAHSAAGRICQEVTEGLNHLQGTPLDQQLDRISSSKNPVFVGFREFTSEEKVVVNPPKGRKEVWLIRETGGQPTLYIYGFMTGEGAVYNLPLEPGEPMFAAEDGATTVERLKPILRRFPDAKMKDIRNRPDWPANIPEL